MSVRAALALAMLAGLAGCKQVFGLQDPQIKSSVVTGKTSLRWMENGPDSKPEPHDRQYAKSEIALSARLDDGTPVAVDIADDGAFSFPVAYPGQVYSLAVATPYSARTIRNSAATLDLADPVAGHPDR